MVDCCRIFPLKKRIVLRSSSLPKRNKTPIYTLAVKVMLKKSVGNDDIKSLVKKKTKTIHTVATDCFQMLPINEN